MTSSPIGSVAMIDDQDSYKEIVQQIKHLNWCGLDTIGLTKVWYLSWIAAVEFAEALRITLDLYPNHRGLAKMARGELKTRNLRLEDYLQAGDHHEFLEHFLNKQGVINRIDEALVNHGVRYMNACRELSDTDRAMTVFSRELELAGIFERILEAPDWSAPGLYAFRHYLSRHIVFDSSVGGHHELTSDFPVDDRVKPFYQARLDSFRLIPILFEKARD
jgi:hypothetical protein